MGRAAWAIYKAKHDKTACNSTLKVDWQTLIDSVNSTAGDYVTSLAWKQIPLIDPTAPDSKWSTGGVLSPIQLGQLLGEWGNCTNTVSIEPVTKATAVSDPWCAAQRVTRTTFEKVFGVAASMLFLL